MDVADFFAGGALAAGAAAAGFATACLVCGLVAITGFKVADFSSVPTGTFTRIVSVFVCAFVVAGACAFTFAAGCDFLAAGFAGLAAAAFAGAGDFLGAAGGA